MISLCAAAATQNDQHWELSAKMGETKSSPVSWAQAGLSDECDGLVTKANIRWNTSSCNTDPAKPRTGIHPPEPDSQVLKDAHCNTTATGETRENWKVQWQAVSRKVWARPEWGSGTLPQTPQLRGKQCGLSATCTTGPRKGWLKVRWFNPDLVTPNFSRELLATLWRQMETLSRDDFTSNQATWSDRYSSTFNYNPTKYFNSHLFHSILDNTHRNQLKMNHQLHGKLSSQVSWAYVHPGPSPASSNSQGTFYWAISQCQFPCLTMAIQQEMRQSLMSNLTSFQELFRDLSLIKLSQTSLNPFLFLTHTALAVT